jgi:phasin family protein
LMADETKAVKATEAADKVESAAAETPAEAKAETVEAKPTDAEAVEAEAKTGAKPAEAKPAAKAPAAKRAAKAAASKPVKTAPAAKPVKAVKAKPVRKPARKKKATPARAGSNRIEGAMIMTKQTNGVDAGLFAAEQFKTVFGDVNERAKAAVERSAKIVEELADLTRADVEAFVASSKVAAKGVETLSQDAAEYSRKSFEEASAALKSFAEVKSATDLFKLQGDFARAAFDSAVAESARLSETVLKLAGDVAEPITNRYTVAAERVKTLAA